MILIIFLLICRVDTWPSWDSPSGRRWTAAVRPPSPWRMWSTGRTWSWAVCWRCTSTSPAWMPSSRPTRPPPCVVAAASWAASVAAVVAGLALPVPIPGAAVNRLAPHTAPSRTISGIIIITSGCIGGAAPCRRWTAPIARRRTAATASCKLNETKSKIQDQESWWKMYLQFTKLQKKKLTKTNEI